MANSEKEIQRRLSKIQISATISTFLTGIAFLIYVFFYEIIINRYQIIKLSANENIFYASLILITGLFGIISSMLFHYAATLFEENKVEQGVQIEKIADFLLNFIYICSSSIIVFLTFKKIEVIIVIFAAIIILFVFLKYSKFLRKKKTVSDIKINGPSLQDSLNNLGEALKIVTDNSSKYYFKDALNVSKKTLEDINKSLIPITKALQKFQFSWIDSKKQGPDAVETSTILDNRIDIKLFQTKSLDFEQLKKILTRLNRADDALLALNRIDFYLSYYKNLCDIKGLKNAKNNVELFISILKSTIKHINSEIERYKNTLERCNLYFQNELSSKSFRIAFLSLLISSVSVFLSIFLKMI